jgi:putative transposase
MQVFGLPGHVIRNGRAASRLIAAKPPSSAAAIRRDALERWRLLMGRGLSAAVAAKGVGIARATLYRWRKRIEPKSRRPHRVRRPTWTGGLVQMVERLRADHPMWGKRKITVLLRRQGIAVSVSTVGGSIRNLVCGAG